MANSEGSAPRRLQSVDQAFEIIEFLREKDSATLSEIASHFDMPMSTAHIHLSTLVHSEYVVRADDEYRCSFRFLGTGGELRDDLALYQAAKTEVDDLQKNSGEHANLTVKENGYAVQLYKSRSPESIDDNAPLGKHLYLHSTATGKAILAELTEEEVVSVIEKRGLPQQTEETITERDALIDELEIIQDQGYSVNRGEHYSGVCAVATSIKSKPDDALGAVSVSGPLSRMGSQRIETEIVPKLRNKKNIIDLKLKQL